ncbi:MAG: HAD family hydrolase, partial [Steroidobacteraceae bacterium]
RERFGQLVAEYLARSGACAPIPGGAALLESLRRRPDLHVGIATGGWGHTALMKLRAAGYTTAGLAVASADDAFTRTQILEIAHIRLAPAAAAVYVGDGEWDRRACESLGWPFVGIGGRLRGQCEHWMPDLLSGHVLGALLAAATNDRSSA